MIFFLDQYRNNFLYNGRTLPKTLFFLPKSKSWQDSDLAVPFVGVLDNGGEILITILSELILGATAHRGKEKREMPVSDECSCACPVLANYILTQCFKGSYENQTGVPADAVQNSTDRCRFIMLLTSSDLLLGSSSFFRWL